MNLCFPKNGLQKALLMSILMLNNAFSEAQTTLINPTGNGGFEMGSTFAANGWVTVNDAIDGWALGNAPTAASGARAAYLSPDAGATWGYSQINKITHLYKEVTIPAGETSLKLSFKWKANGEGAGTSDNDNLKVFFTPSNVILTQGTALSSFYQIAGSGATFNMYKLNPTNYNSDYIVFTAVPGTYRLVFSWKSDATAITAAHQPPAAIDDVSLIATVPTSITSTAVGGSWGSPQTWVGGVIPGGGDDVTIAAGANVVVDNRFTVRDLTIAGMLHWNATFNALTVIRDVLIQSTGVFNPFTTTTGGQSINVGGHFTNNGVANLALSTLSLNGSNQNSRLVQNFTGTGTFIGTGTSGIIRNFYTQTTGDVVVNTPQNLIVTGTFSPAAGTLNTNGKITLDNTAQVYGQAFNQSVAQIVMTNMGAGYTSQPTVAIDAPTGAGTPATAVANYDAATGTVRSITITNAGTGYRVAPVVTIVGGGTPTMIATAVANVFTYIAGSAQISAYKSTASIMGGLTIVNGQRLGSIYTLNSTTTNRGYTSAPEVGFSLPTNVLNLVTAGGSGYTSTPTITVTGGTQLTGGAAPSFSVVVAQGKVVSVLCNNGGSLWTALPTLTITGGGGTGAEATFPANCLPQATALISNEMISGFTITNEGFGYLSAPSAGVVGGGGVAPNLSCRIGNYYLYFTLSNPSTVLTPYTEDAFMPSHRRINQIYINNPAGIQLTGDVELYGNNPLALLQGAIQVGPTGNHFLNFTNPNYAGTSGTTTSWVHGGIKMVPLGGSFSRNIPFETLLTVNTGNGTFATASNVTQLTVRSMALPNGTVAPSGNLTGVRSYNILANTGAIYGANAFVTMNYNANDGIAADNATLFIAQATANTGAWTTRSTAAAAGVLPATGSRTTLIGMPQGGIEPIVMTGDDYFAWATTFDFNASIASGNWDAATTWSKGRAPNCTESAYIQPTHMVTVNSAGNIAKKLTINPLGTLTITTDGALTVGCTGQNNTLSLKGTLNVQSGFLRVNGNIEAANVSTFTQSGGNIHVDGNDNGAIATSVAAGTPLISLQPSFSNQVNWTGGNLTIIDPHAGITASDVLRITGTLKGAVNTTTGHTVRFGNGLSTDPGGVTNGFITTANSGAYLPYGNVIVEGAAGVNRVVTTGLQYIRGNWTVNSGGVVNMNNATYLKGDLVVNEGGIFNCNSTISCIDFAFSAAGVTYSPAPNAQSITNLGNMRWTTFTVNMSGLTINNNHPNGVTLNSPLSVYNLTLTAGKINTTHTNPLTLGFSIYNGILTGGSPKAYINGPLIRNFAAKATDTIYNQTVLFPIGKDSNYAPIYLNPTTSAGGLQVKAEAFTTNTGTFENPFNNIAARRWEVTKALNGNVLTSIGVREVDTANITATKEILQAATANGVYRPILPATTFDSTRALTTATPILAADFTGFLSYGERCQTPNAPTAVTQSFCGSKTVANLAATPSTGGMLKWYATMAATTPLMNTDSIATNTYYVTQTVLGGCESTRLPVGVAVNAFPLATISALTNATFCQGGNVTLKANTEAGLTYQWKKDSTVIATATDSMYIAATTGAFTVITTNLSGCTTTAAPITVTVNARPTPMLRANGNATFCQGDSVRLSIAGGATYLWSTTSMDTSIWVKTSGSYGVTVTNSNNCTAIDSIQVVVNALPMSTLTAGTSATFCQGDSVLLKATSGTNFTYQWLKNGAILSGITASTYRTNTAGSYAAVVRDDNGCSNASPALLVTVNALPSATATASGATTFCKGSNVVMAANAGNRLMYQWMDSTAIIGNATNRTYGTLRTGAFSVMVTDSNGCKSASSVINVTVHNNPSANFTNSIQAGSGSIVDFTNTSSAGTVQWSFGDSLNSTSTQANPTFWYKSNGSYTVKLVVTNANGCADSTSTMITVTRVRTSNQELATALDVKVFPNPFSEQMTVKIENTTVELGNNDRLIVTNGLGQIVHQSVLNQKIIELNTQDWATGIYNLTIYTKGQMIPIKKMVKI